MKPTLAPHGERTGEILLDGTPVEALPLREQSARIGFVRQNPEEQIVTDKVWHELAFGPESLGMDTGTIRRRVAEMAAYFGMEGWYHRDTASLSGGQKQLLNLAAVMVLQPEVLILDEPTAQLDPIAASEFLATLRRLNRELGTTVILAEHRLEEAVACADRVAVLERGALTGVSAPSEAGALLAKQPYAPAAMALWAACGGDGPCPVTVREGRDWLAKRENYLPVPPEQLPVNENDPVITAKELHFRYDREGADVLRGLDLTVKRGELLAILGGNGVGKSTLLRLLSGMDAPQRGALTVNGTVGLLPQDPKLLFLKKTLREELSGAGETLTAQTVGLCGLESLLDRHPYDLSGGEQQRAAMAKLLLASPEILLLDEPTKGLDGGCKEDLASILKTLTEQGTTVVLVSHDVEFCARYAHRCAMLFDGNLVAEGTPRQFFAGNSHYTTAADRMARGIVPGAVTTEDLIAACGGTVPPAPVLPEFSRTLPPPRAGTADWKPAPLPRWRQLLALLFAAVMAFGIIWAAANAGQDDPARLWQYGVVLLSATAFALCLFRRQPTPAPLKRQKLTGRTVVACVTILLCIPATLYVGLVVLQSPNYYLIMLLVLLECMLPFFFVFEKRRPGARELTLLAVLCALGVAGRGLFFMLPQCKPVVALTIIAGVALGGESGFLVGALTMLVSNLLFGQGPWTPWQMFAMGLIGFLAGILFRKGLLRRSRAALCIFGAFASIVLYGGIMNPASALMWAGELRWSVLVPYWVSGFPMDCVQGLSTALFLWFAAAPMLDKLDRIKVKYGLAE